MTGETTIRVGLIGAGGNMRERHIPGFRALSGIELIAVANRSRESAERVAQWAGIPRVYEHWHDLLADPEIDAVCIGTWPDTHCAITEASLAAGKHTLCEARMAMDATQARRMLTASRQRPDLVAQVVPSPFTLGIDACIAEQLGSGILGDIIAVDIELYGRNFPDPTAVMTWRQDADRSGFNTLALGIGYEALMRWLGPATRVLARSRTVVAERPDGRNGRRPITVPDHVDVLADLACGAAANLRFSDVSGFGRYEGRIFGSKGVLWLDLANGRVHRACRGETGFTDVTPPPDRQGKWRVEESFINAIRGLERITLTNFEDGLRYMEFTEAVARASASGVAVALPLDGGREPSPNL